MCMALDRMAELAVLFKKKKKIEIVQPLPKIDKSMQNSQHFE